MPGAMEAPISPVPSLHKKSPNKAKSFRSVQPVVRVTFCQQTKLMTLDHEEGQKMPGPNTLKVTLERMEWIK